MSYPFLLIVAGEELRLEVSAVNYTMLLYLLLLSSSLRWILEWLSSTYVLQYCKGNLGFKNHLFQYEQLGRSHSLLMSVEFVISEDCIFARLEIFNLIKRGEG